MAIPVPRSIALWPVDQLRPYERNPRTHGHHQIQKLKASLIEFGWTNPILISKDGGILAGHGRLVAARELGIDLVPVIELSHLTAAQQRAYVIADNRLALDAGWDEELLADELRMLEVEGFDLAATGFEIDELYGLLNDEAAVEVSVPQPPDDPVSRPGDLWILGNHRLLCGDSSDPANLDRLLGGARIHLVNTDPPYNVNVEPRSNNAIAAGRSSFPATTGARTSPQMRAKDRPISNDVVDEDGYRDLMTSWFHNIARVLEPGRAFYLYGGYANCARYPHVLKAAGLYFSQAIIWVKEHPVLNRKDFMGNHEWIFYGWREGAAHKFFGPQNVTDVWSIKKVSSQSMVHLTEKPVELAVRAIQYSSLPGENVLDLFGGSGSTLVGAERTQRNAFLMEIDPAYTDVIVQRWQENTGAAASLDGDGRTFSAISEDRRGTGRN